MREISGRRAIVAISFLFVAFLVASCGEIPMRDYTTTEVIAIIVFTVLSIAVTFRMDEVIAGFISSCKKANAN